MGQGIDISSHAFRAEPDHLPLRGIPPYLRYLAAAVYAVEDENPP